MTGTYNVITTERDDWYAGLEIICINDHQKHDKINYLARYIVLDVESDGHGRFSVKIISKVDQQPYWIDSTRFMPSARFDRLQEDGTTEKEQTVAVREPQLYDGAFGDEVAAPRTQADKADAGKVRTLIFDQDFSEAQDVVAQVFEYGAQKYSRKSFYRIAFDDWEAAETRHKKARYRGELRDPESNLLHLAHQAANAIVMLQLYVKNNPGEDFLTYNPPPQDHKKNG
jgi:hypothetical protein